MSSILSLQKITNLWQNAASFTETAENGIPLSESIFNLDFDDDERAYFYFSNKKGEKLSLEEILPDSTPIGTAVSRIRQQKLSFFSWGGESDNEIYLDQYADFTYQIFKGDRKFLYKDEIVSNSEEKERAKIILMIDENSVTNEKKDSVSIFLALKTENAVLKNPIPLCSTYVLCDKKIFKTRDIGISYNYLKFFSGNVKKSEFDQTLSFFASIFPSIKIEMEGFSFVTQIESEADAAINFHGLDEDGNLEINLLWSKEPYPTEFISKNKPSCLVHLNQEKKTIEKTPLIYDSEKNTKKINSLLKSCLARHPECKEEDSSAFTIEGDTIYITADLALRFLSENLSELAKNYRLFGTDALKKYKLKNAKPSTKLRLKSGIDFFDTECEIDIDGEIFSPSQFVKLYEENQFIPLNDGTRAIIDKTFFLRLKRLLGKQQKDGTYKISFFDLPLVDGLINAKIEGAEKTPWQKFFSGFNEIQNLALKKLPVIEKLRDYQRYGVQWLSYLISNNLGACLADDMGLGKTIQTISVLALFYAESGKKTSLVIVPKSLIDNWAAEFAKFAPQISVYAYYGMERNIDEAMKNEIVLTTYAVARNDIETLQKQDFEFAVLDEVQQIKNTQSQASKAVMLLNAKHKIALSGTPMENNLGELYSIFRFLNPSMFGTEGDFNRRYGNPIQKEGDEDAAKELGAKIRPFILRRLKQEVAKELPDRTEQVMYVDMTENQARLYEQQRRFYQNMIQGEIAKNGFEKSQFCILQGLSELRQIATVPEAKTDGAIESAKWEILIETISELASSGHRCLVFSNFLASIDAVGERLSASDIPHIVMTGATQNRQALVKKFQEDEKIKVFLMTLKTGGVGLNLTGADYVFILDPWWNRSAEQQAIDRTHRIGQTRSVFCYRLIARNTIEEKILELQKKKSDLFSAVISSDGQQIKKLSEEDINYLLRG